MLKMNLCLNFYFLFIFSLHMKLLKYAAELYAPGGIHRSLLLHMDQIVCAQRALQTLLSLSPGAPPVTAQDPMSAPTASVPAPVMLQHGWSPAPHSSVLPRAMDKLVMKKYTANYYPCLIYIVYKIHIIQYIFHLAYGKHLMTCYAKMKSQMKFFLKTITNLMLYCNLLQSRFQKRKGRWVVEGHTGAFSNIFIGFGGYLLL